jgi:hypothetical protein
VSLRQDSEYTLNTLAWTLELWVKPTTLATRQVLFSEGSGAGGFALVLTTTGQLQYVGSANVQTGVSAVCTAAWSHVAAVFAAGTVTLYVNGVAGASGAVAQGTQAGTAIQYAGALNGTSQFLSRALAELAVYPTAALTQARLATHYAEQQKGVSDGFLFTGYVDGWPPTYPDKKDALVTIGVTDAFKIFAQTPLANSVWEYQLRQIPQLWAWFRLNDGAGVTHPVDSGPNGFQAYAIDTTLGESGLLQPYSEETGATFPTTGSAVVLKPRAQLGNRVANGVWSIEMLVQRNPATPIDASGDEVLWSLSGSNSTALILMGGGGGVGFAPVTTNGSMSVSFFGTINDGRTHHVALTSDGTNYALYLDGVQVTAAPWGTFHIDNSSLQVLGNTGGVGGSQFQGTLQEFASYKNLALTAAQVAQHPGWALQPWAGDTSDQRIARLLPAGLGGDLLSYLQSVANTEESLLAMDVDGAVLFLNRDQSYLAPGNTVQQTFGDGGAAFPTELPYTDYDPEYDDVYVVNQVRAGTAVGAAIVVNGAPSQAVYGLRGMDNTSLLSASQLEVADHANFLLNKQQMPHLEIRGLGFAPRSQVDSPT